MFDLGKVYPRAFPRSIPGRILSEIAAAFVFTSHEAYPQHTLKDSSEAYPKVKHSGQKEPPTKKDSMYTRHFNMLLR